MQRKLQPAEAKAVSQNVGMRSPKKRRRNHSPEDDDDIVEIVKPISKKNGQRSGLSPAVSSGSSSEHHKVSLPIQASHADHSVAPQPVPCPVCQKQVPLTKINQHLDDGCKSPTPTDFEVGPSSAVINKGKQKQDWQKLFGAAESSSGAKGKGKLKYVLFFLNVICPCSLK